MNDGTGPLAGRVVIVTGASSGLGERFAQVLHADGADVVAVGRRADRLEALRGSLGDRLHPFACDLAIDDERERLVAEVNGRHGRIDVLVNNAGLGNAMPALDETLDHLRMVFEVNVIAVFHLCQLVGRLMIEAGSGTIVNMASILGLVASAPLNQASYCASKGAVVNLTRQLGSEWARKGVRVNALAPGWFPSEMTADMWEDEGTTSFVHRNTPIGRTGRPEELDDALRFLLAENNGFYTGQILTVDGGWTAR